MFSSTALANEGLKLKFWCFISTYYVLLLIHKVGICLHAHLNLYTSSLGNDFTYWEVLMNYQLLLFPLYVKNIWPKRIEIKESKYFSKVKLNCCIKYKEMLWILQKWHESDHSYLYYSSDSKKMKKSLNYVWGLIF